MNLHCVRWVRRNDMGKKTFQMRYRGTFAQPNLFPFKNYPKPSPLPTQKVPFWGFSHLIGKLFSLIRCGCVVDAV